MQLSACRRLLQGRLVYDHRSGERLVFQRLMKKMPNTDAPYALCMRAGVRTGSRFVYVPVSEMATRPRQYYPLTSKARAP